MAKISASPAITSVPDSTDPPSNPAPSTENGLLSPMACAATVPATWSAARNSLAPKPRKAPIIISPVNTDRIPAGSAGIAGRSGTMGFRTSATMMATHRRTRTGTANSPNPGRKATAAATRTNTRNT